MYANSAEGLARGFWVDQIKMEEGVMGLFLDAMAKSIRHTCQDALKEKAAT